MFRDNKQEREREMSVVTELPHRCYYKIVREEKIQDFPENPPKTDQISQSYEMMHTF